ncbi:hypothetical protein PMZ80_011308 [Knufia obscura]|uniref:B box-type domain-containing protein n=1 Tax=Knufia obscura TaxID=1635080 RepID=A0ABR0R860_9EURO|nr:hypothetical protein PMZ80_011308 [Knufia obscura]
MSQCRILKPKQKRSSKPERPKSERNLEIYRAIAVTGNEAIVSYSACISNNVVCYYDREQSVKCAECVLHQRSCDGTFALEEFRKVGELKRAKQQKRREKSKQITKLRSALLTARQALQEAEATMLATEEEINEIDESIAALEDKSSRMLKREMQALGVFNSLPDEQEIALGDQDFVWEDIPLVQQVDLGGLFGGQESLSQL